MGRLPKLCHCGRPEHIPPEHRRAVYAEIARHGPYMTVWGPGDRWWLVPRTWLAGHKTVSMSEIHLLGFKEVFR